MCVVCMLQRPAITMSITVIKKNIRFIVRLIKYRIAISSGVPFVLLGVQTILKAGTHGYIHTYIPYTAYIHTYTPDQCVCFCMTLASHITTCSCLVEYLGHLFPLSAAKIYTESSRNLTILVTYVPYWCICFE